MDGDGYLHLDLTKVHEVEKLSRERDLSQAGKPWQSRLVSLGDVLAFPDLVAWHAHHFECDPDRDHLCYWFDVEKARTHAHLLNWTAHLMEKTWLTYTDWDELIRRQARTEA